MKTATPTPTPSAAAEPLDPSAYERGYSDAKAGKESSNPYRLPENRLSYEDGFLDYFAP